MTAVMENDRVRLPVGELKEIITKLLEKVSVPAADAATVAEVMAYGDLTGIESHGVRWLDIYLKRLQAGCVKPVTNLTTVREKAGFVLYDAGGGFGQVAMLAAMRQGIAKAKNAGTCVVAVRNSNHFGAAGYYTKLAAEAGMISMLMTNSTPLMAPWGGTTLCVGTNPIAFGFPSRDRPVILDMATSATARGRVFVAAQRGVKLAPGLALNKDGEPTIEPKEALEGVLLPVGGPKGYGLSLVIDMMAGILTGSNFGCNITSLFGDLEHAQDIGHFALIVNTEDFIAMDDYLDKMAESREQLKGSKLAKGFDKIFLPGEIEANTYDANEKNGVSLPMATWNFLQEWKDKFGIQ